jgi:hypothetical protein
VFVAHGHSVQFLPCFMNKAQKSKTESGKEPVEHAAAPAAPASQDERRRPLTTLREGDVSASVWSKTVQYKGKPLTLYSVSVERSYKDAGGSWRYTRSFDADDLGKLVTVAHRAAEYINGLRS